MDITVRKVSAWFFGILFILGGLGMTTESLLSGIITFLAGLFLIPNVRQEIDNRFDIQFSTWMVVLITIVGLGISGAVMPSNTSTIAPSDTSTSNDTNISNQSPSTDNKQTRETSLDSRTHSVGESFTVGEISYKVTGIRTARVVGSNPYLQEEADGEFILVDVEVKNEAKESTTISDTHMKLVDAQGRSYSVDSDAFATLENGFTFRQLDPGLSESGTLIYDTPLDQEGRQLEVSPAAVFSTAKPHYVNLSQ